jgi:hypothetical protein
MDAELLRLLYTIVFSASNAKKNSTKGTSNSKTIRLRLNLKFSSPTKESTIIITPATTDAFSDSMCPNFDANLQLSV